MYGEQIPRPTDEEREAMREQFDEVTLPTGTANEVPSQHLNPTGEDGDRLCINRSTKNAEEYRTAPLAAFPGDHFSPCLECVSAWREEQ